MGPKIESFLMFEGNWEKKWWQIQIGQMGGPTDADNYYVPFQLRRRGQQSMTPEFISFAKIINALMSRSLPKYIVSLEIFRYMLGYRLNLLAE